MMIGLDRSDMLLSLAQRVGYVKEKKEDDQEEEEDDGRRREVMIADVLDCGGVRPASMVSCTSVWSLFFFVFFLFIGEETKTGSDM